MERGRHPISVAGSEYEKFCGNNVVAFVPNSGFVVQIGWLESWRAYGKRKSQIMTRTTLQAGELTVPDANARVGPGHVDIKNRYVEINRSECMLVLRARSKEQNDQLQHQFKYGDFNMI